MRPLLHAALAAVCLTAGLILPTASAHAAQPTKVAIIVGPVGSLTPTYLALAEAAAATAEAQGATVARAYSPNATPANVLAAVEDANVIVYFGHGYGHPSPYGGLNTAKQNGWGLQGPAARGTHADGLNGYIAYYGEDWIVANARPAPGFVMIYSNTCYAPGASEGGHAPATPQVAAERVAYYSRKVFRMGGSAYFATDFDRGAADLVGGILANRGSTYGSLFASDRRFLPYALTTQPHLFSAGQQIWLHRSKYTDGPPNYWYAFAGNPDATPMRSWDPDAPTVKLREPEAGAAGVAPWADARLRLNEAVRGIDSSTVRLIGPNGKAVRTEVSYDAASGVVRVSPTDDLALSTRYTIEVRKGVVDEAGNPLAPRTWSFTTRIDADPWSAEMPIVLGEGPHRLVRVAADGTVTEKRTVELDGARELVARTRARLPDRSGSWLEIASGRFEGWWVAESARSYVVGLAEEVALPKSEVRLSSGPTATLDGSTLPARDRLIDVDRRAVVDGRSYLRVAGNASTWILAPPSAELDKVSGTGILERRDLREPADLRVETRKVVAFRFDDAGRVVDRRTVAGADAEPMRTTGTVLVNGRWFHALGGDHRGWAVQAGDHVSVELPEERDPS